MSDIRPGVLLFDLFKRYDLYRELAPWGSENKFLTVKGVKAFLPLLEELLVEAKAISSERHACLSQIMASITDDNLLDIAGKLSSAAFDLQRANEELVQLVSLITLFKTNKAEQE